MNVSTYEFKFSLFGKKVQMFHEGGMGIVIEKESQVVCVYGTDSANSNILCAIPLCHPKFLKGLTYKVAFQDDNTAVVSVGDIMIYIDFESRKCSNNKGVKNFGSDKWGEDISVDWDDDFIKQ
ncbi:MAG: hypothetical protein ACI3XL_00480 [Eubacteriales bacterium]